jgi:programmed cell death 6-interacting protein
MQSLKCLDQEQHEDEEMRRLYGPRWTRMPSSTLTIKLREKGTEFKEKIDFASQSNTSVRKKIEKNMFLMEHLSMDKKELEASIPSGTTVSSLALKDPNLKQLKSSLDALNRNIKLRPEIIARLKKLGDADDIGPLLTKNALASPPVEDSILFDVQIKKYNDDILLIDFLIEEQGKLLESILVFINSQFRRPTRFLCNLINQMNLSKRERLLFQIWILPINTLSTYLTIWRKVLR